MFTSSSRSRFPLPNDERGLTLIEFVMVMVLISVLVTMTVPMVQDQLEKARYETTRAKMEVIRDAIVGVDWNKTDGPRANFGYAGDMGRIPEALTELTTQGSQAAWTFDTASAISAGWRGPYITSGATGSQNWNQDEWGQAFIYVGTTWPGSIVSYGADRTTGGTGYAKDLTIHLETYQTQATLRGVLLDNNRRIAGGVVELAFVTNGTLVTSVTTTGASGNFTYAGIPMGARAMRVTSPASIPYRPIRIDRPDMPATASLNFYGATEALSWNTASENLFGGASAGTRSDWVLGTFKSTFTKDLTIAGVTFGCTNGAHVTSYLLNGIETVLANSPECGTRSTVNNNQVIPAGSDVNTLEIRFDANMGNIPISVTFDFTENAPSQTLSFRPNPTWVQPSGTLDTAFGTGGSLQINSGGGNLDVVEEVMLQTDGRLIILGECNSKGCLARLLTDGSLDTSFATRGYSLYSFGTATDRVAAGYLQTDGRIVASGSPGSIILYFFRLHTNGTYDTSFGTVGSSLYTIRNAASVNVMIQGAQGRPMGMGYAITGGVYDNLVLRVTTNGRLDTSFSTTGYSVISQLGTGGVNILTVAALQTDGRAVTAGINYFPTVDTRVFRYHTNGTLDTSFRTVGYAPTGYNDGGTAFPWLAIDSRGKIFTATGLQVLSNDLIRWNTNGTFDTSFATTGVVKNTNATYGTNCQRVLNANGTVVLGGTKITAPKELFLQRIRSNGTYDTAFATIGFLFRTQGAVTNGGPCLIAQTDGKVLTVFQTSTGGATGWDLVVRRFWP